MTAPSWRALRKALVALPFIATVPFALAGPGDDTTPVPTANTKAVGAVRPNTLTTELLGRCVVQATRAEGCMALENPQATVNGVQVTHYGYYDNGPMMPALGSNVEASKSEPDKNTYLVFDGPQHGPAAGYDYGHHFVFQGHELGLRTVPAVPGDVPHGYITRVNLDADVAHRVTLMSVKDSAGNFLPVYDGSSWYPFAGVLLFTAELGNQGGVWSMTPDYPATSMDLSGSMGRGGYEGIQADSDGNLWIVEDVGGSTGTAAGGFPNARRPNSFVYRFLPKRSSDLTQGGRLQVLQVASKAHAGAIVFNPLESADTAVAAQDMLDVHSYANTFDTKWITIHDTAVDGFTPFDANAAAKSKGGTPFKRPENGIFRPDTRFREFFFTETGDTNNLTQVGSAGGGFGGLFRLVQGDPSDDTGKLNLFYRGDSAHTGLDNIQFLAKDLVLSGEDAGDTLHTQRNALDSLWMFDVNVSYGAVGAPGPVRILAEGRDPAATVDSGLSGSAGFPNDGDNEITGVCVSDGDPTVRGLLGVRKPRAFRGGWRVFWSQQHGNNLLWEILAVRGACEDCDD